jgi:putative tricarboxylic transport membrane protein
MQQLTRILAAGVLAAIGMTGTAPAAFAQGDLKIIAPAAPGGGWDQTARSMQAALVASGAAKSAQVVNVPGAGGTVGLAQFINGAKGDATQLMVNGLVMVGAIITNKAPVTLDMVTPIARLTGEYLAVVVPANSPIKDAKALGEALKADPAKVTFAGGSAGGVDHMFVGLFAKAVGADATKINYIPFSGGGEALAAILGGKVTAGVSGYGEFEGQIKSGKLRLLAITSDRRLPNVDGPTLKEQGIDLDVINWRSVFAAPGITPEQRATLLTAVEKMAKSPAWAETLKAKGWDDAYLPGDQFAAFLKQEQTRVSSVLASIGLAK